jgi:hypothetical protein
MLFYRVLKIKENKVAKKYPNRYMIAYYHEQIPTIEPYFERTTEFLNATEEQEQHFGITFDEAKDQVILWLEDEIKKFKNMSEKEYFWSYDEDTI